MGKNTWKENLEMAEKFLKLWYVKFIFAGLIFWFIMTPTSDFRILSSMLIPFASILLLVKCKKTVH